MDRLQQNPERENVIRQRESASRWYGASYADRPGPGPAACCGTDDLISLAIPIEKGRHVTGQPLACSNHKEHPLEPMPQCLMNPSNKVGGFAEPGLPVKRACPQADAVEPPGVHIRFKSNLSNAVVLSRVLSYYTLCVYHRSKQKSILNELKTRGLACDSAWQMAFHKRRLRDDRHIGRDNGHPSAVRRFKNAIGSELAGAGLRLQEFSMPKWADGHLIPGIGGFWKLVDAPHGRVSRGGFWRGVFA